PELYTLSLHDALPISPGGSNQRSGASGYHHRLPVNRNFLTGEELSRDELAALLDRGLALKAGRAAAEGARALGGASVALVFEKPDRKSTRLNSSHDQI